MRNGGKTHDAISAKSVANVICERPVPQCLDKGPYIEKKSFDRNGMANLRQDLKKRYY